MSRKEIWIHQNLIRHMWMDVIMNFFNRCCDCNFGLKFWCLSGISLFDFTAPSHPGDVVSGSSGLHVSVNYYLWAISLCGDVYLSSLFVGHGMGLIHIWYLDAFIRIAATYSCIGFCGHCGSDYIVLLYDFGPLYYCMVLVSDASPSRETSFRYAVAGYTDIGRTSNTSDGLGIQRRKMFSPLRSLRL